MFAGPEVRRLTAEQFADAIGAITGEWSVYPDAAAAAPAAAGRGGPPPIDPPTAGVYGREWRAASSNLTRALGRPIRDQVTLVASDAADDAAGAGAGERRDADALALARRAADARRAAAGAARACTTRPSPAATPAPSAFDIDVSKRREALAGRAGERIERAGARPAGVGAGRARRRRRGARRSSSLTPVDAQGLRPDRARSGVAGSRTARRARQNPSRAGLRHRRAGLHAVPRQRRRSRTRGATSARRSTRSCGSSCSTPSRTWSGCCRRRRSRRCRRPARRDRRRRRSIACSGTRSAARRRPPSGSSRRARLRDPARAGTVRRAEGLADLLWAVMMKPEFS